jgi:hypothetical protein
MEMAYLFLRARLADSEVVLVPLYELSFYPLIHPCNYPNFITHLKHPLHINKGSLHLLYDPIEFKLESD